MGVYETLDGLHLYIYVKHELQFLHFNSRPLCRYHDVLSQVRVTQDEDIMCVD